MINTYYALILRKMKSILESFVNILVDLDLTLLITLLIKMPCEL